MRLDKDNLLALQADPSTLEGIVFNVQRFSLHDGPGIRTTVFLKGCPLRCEWCHNTEGIDPFPQVRLTSSLCTLCGHCVAACIRGGHEITPEGKHLLHIERCERCGRCAEACPSAALEMAGRLMSVDEIVQVARRDKDFYEQSGGGITLSGGEPLFQPTFSWVLLREAKRHGLHTALDTSAFTQWAILDLIAPSVDLFLVDLKHTDSARHKALTGVSNKRILANIRGLAEAGFPLVIRVPWVPGRNTDEQFLEGLRALVLSLSPLPPVEFLPYHRLGRGKRAALGHAPAPLDDTPAATPDDLLPWLERLQAAGITASIV